MGLFMAGFRCWLVVLQSEAVVFGLPGNQPGRPHQGGLIDQPSGRTVTTTHRPVPGRSNSQKKMSCQIDSPWIAIDHRDGLCRSDQSRFEVCVTIVIPGMVQPPRDTPGACSRTVCGQFRRHIKVHVCPITAQFRDTAT